MEIKAVDTRLNLQYIALVDTIVNTSRSIGAGISFGISQIVSDNDTVSALTDERNVGGTQVCCGTWVGVAIIAANSDRFAQRKRVSAILHEDAKTLVFVATAVGGFDGCQQFVNILDHDIVETLLHSGTLHSAEGDDNVVRDEVASQVAHGVSLQMEFIVRIIFQSLIFECDGFAADHRCQFLVECRIVVGTHWQRLGYKCIRILYDFHAFVEGEDNLACG